MKTCFMCRKPVEGEGLVLEVDSGSKEPPAELRYHLACRKAYVKEKSSQRGYDYAKDLWEQRLERWFKRIRRQPRRYV